MKILIYDKFMESFIRLPKQVQDKVLDFQKKFRENSRSAAIHLEPIGTFKDPQLRTARIDQKYRIIVRVPESGDIYGLIWVDNHDEAMEWARNKTIAWNSQTQAFQVFTAPEETLAAEPQQSYTSPAAQGLFKDFSDGDLEKIGVPSVLLPSVRAVNDLDGLDALDAYLPKDAFENLFYLADGADIKLLIAEVEEGKVDSEQFEAQLESINNRRNFLLATGDELFDDAFNGRFDNWRFFLHPSQRILVEKDYTGTVKVSGGAGTGKTVAALHRLKYLQDRYKPAKPILFTTFTKALTQNLGGLLEKMRVDMRHVRLLHIDALTLQLGQETGLLPPSVKIANLYGSGTSSRELWEKVLETHLSEFDAGFLDAEYQQVVLYHDLASAEEYLAVSRFGRGKPITRKQRKDVWALVEAYRSLCGQEGYLQREELMNRLARHFKGLSDKPYSHVIADEVQDFSNTELRLVRSLCQEGPNDLFLVGDPLQKIYSRRIRFSDAGIHVRGKRSKRLRINYRTTEEIKRLAVSVVKEATFDNFDGEQEEKGGYVSLFHGDAPLYQTFKTKQEELVFVVQGIRELQSKQVELKSIAVAARVKEALKEIRTALHQEGLPYLDLTGPTPTGNSEGVHLFSFHNLKGLEFDAVFLTDVNERTCPFKPYSFEEWEETAQAEHLSQERSLLYVVMTRARRWLYLSGIGKKSDWVK